MFCKANFIYFLKSTVLLCFFTFTCLNSQAQWQQASGIQGGTVNTFAIKDSIVFAGTDTGGVYSSADNGQHWTAMNNGLANKNVKSLLVKNNLIVAGISDGLSSGVSFLSTNNGATWSPSSNPYFGILFCLTLKGNDILAGTWYGVSKSSDNGSSWTTLPDVGLPSNATVTSLAFIGANIFAGVYGSSTDNSGVFLSGDNGSNWLTRNNGLTDTVITSLATSGTTIFAGTFSGGVFSSSDNGLYWTAVNTGLTNLKINTLMVNGTALFAGTDKGIFLSLNNGLNWKAINDSLPANSSVSSIIVKGEYILAGTAFTVWKRKLIEVVTGLHNEISEFSQIHIYPNPVTNKLFIIAASPYISTNVLIEVMDLKGEKLMSFDQRLQNDKPVSIDISDLGEGIYFLILDNKPYKFVKMN